MKNKIKRQKMRLPLCGDGSKIIDINTQNKCLKFSLISQCLNKANLRDLIAATGLVILLKLYLNP